MGIVSFSQNFEDVLLWRALGHVQEGFYIDVGAQHPTIDSVSKAFYDRGWRGISVEPSAAYAALLRAERPDEVIVEAAVFDQQGSLTFHQIPDTGLSTLSDEVAQVHRDKGFTVQDVVVTSLTMDDLFASAPERPIHWMKIDVEGSEEHVLRGWRKSAKRPWVLVIETTYPNSQRETHRSWEALVTEKGYRLVHNDGLNRYYLSREHPELRRHFGAGPNYWDAFTLTRNAWAARDVVQDYERQLAELRSLHSESERICTALRQDTQEAEQECEVLSRELKAATAQLATQGAAESRKVLALQAAMSEVANHARNETESHLRTLLDRERTFSLELARVQAEWRDWADGQRRTAEGREQRLADEISALKTALEARSVEISARSGELRSAAGELAALRAEREMLLATQAAQRDQLGQLGERTETLAAKVATLDVERAGLVERLRGLSDRSTAEIAGLKQRVGELDADKRRFREQLEQLLEARNSRDQLIVKLKGERDQLTLALDSRDQAIARLNAEREQLAGDRASRDAVISQLRVEREQLAGDRKSRDAAIAQLQAERERLVETASSSQLTMAQLQAERERLVEARDVRDATISQLTAQRDQLVAERDLRDTTIADLRVQRDHLAQAREAGEKAIAELKVSIAQAFRSATEIHHELQKVRQSRVWRAAVAVGLVKPLDYRSPAERGTAQPFPAAASMADRANLSTLSLPGQSMSPIEHVNQLTSLHGEHFILAAYEAVLGRGADATGMDYYLGRLKAGYTKESVICQLARSGEGRKYAARLAGLPELMSEDKRARGFLARFTAAERLERRVGRLEFRLDAISIQVEQLQFTLDALGGNRTGVAPSREGEFAPIKFIPRQTAEPEGNLSSNAREIFDQLVNVRSGNQR